MIVKADMENFLSKCNPETASRGIILFNAATKCAEAYQKDPTSGKLKDWQAAETAVNEFIGSQDSKPADNTKAFKNRIAVVQYLKERGIRISKTKVYRDADRGKLRTQPDGSILLSDVDLYTRAYLSPKKKTSIDPEIEALQKAKLNEEILKLKAQNAKFAHEREIETGKYMLKSDLEFELAARAAVFDTMLRQMTASKVYEWIAIAKGDTNMTKDVMASINNEIDQLFDEYTRTDRFLVIFTTEDSEPKKPAIEINESDRLSGENEESHG